MLQQSYDQSFVQKKWKPWDEKEVKRKRIQNGMKEVLVMKMK